MITLTAESLPAPEAELRKSLAKFLQELADFPDTEGVPAPFPDYDILRVIVASGGDFQVEAKPAEKAPVFDPVASISDVVAVLSNDINIKRALDQRVQAAQQAFSSAIATEKNK